jgi:hypothetical protein
MFERVAALAAAEPAAGRVPEAGRGRELADHLAQRFEVVVRELELAAADARDDLAGVRDGRGLGVAERHPRRLDLRGSDRL